MCSAFRRLPHEKVITPLPVGPNRDRLEIRFQGLGVLKLITSQHQRDIDYSRGMMASPAVSALLFSLKKYDTEDGKRNNDRGYDELLSECSGNVIVCGSSVGGTGASVAITLTRRLFEEHGQKAKIMPLLIHKWFELSKNSQSSYDGKRSKDRNEKMNTNAASVLAYVGEELARIAPTVLVGVPDSKLEARTDTGVNQQAYKDSYIHVIGALAGMQHLLSDETEVSPGLHGLLASDPSRLTGDIKVGEGKSSTLADIVGQAQCLTYVLEIYSRALDQYGTSQSRDTRKLFRNISFGILSSFQLEICGWVHNTVRENVSKVQGIAQHLKDIKETYDDLLRWLRKLGVKYDISEEDEKSLNSGHLHLGRKRQEKLPLLEDNRDILEEERMRVAREEYMALAIFHWVADWVKDWWKAGKSSTKIHQAQGGYWPDPVKGKEAIEKHRIAGGTPGRLFKVSRNNTGRVLRDYYNVSDTSPDGWPHPIAVPSHYKFLIEQKD